MPDDAPQVLQAMKVCLAYENAAKNTNSYVTASALDASLTETISSKRLRGTGTRESQGRFWPLDTDEGGNRFETFFKDELWYQQNIFEVVEIEHLGPWRKRRVARPF